MDLIFDPKRRGSKRPFYWLRLISWKSPNGADANSVRPALEAVDTPNGVRRILIEQSRVCTMATRYNLIAAAGASHRPELCKFAIKRQFFALMVVCLWPLHLCA